MITFNPQDWYWSVGGNIYSSSRNIYVATSDAAYTAWLALHGGPTMIDSEADIWPSVSPFLPAWLFNGATFAQPSAGAYSVAQLKAYAASVRYTKVVGGVTYQGHPIPTDDVSRGNMMAEVLASQVIGTGFSTAWKCSDGTWLPMNGSQVVTFATAVRDYVAACFAVEASLTSPSAKSDIDNAAWPSATLS